MIAASTSQGQNLSVIPEGYAPEGISLTCLDKNTLYLLEHAIPSRLEGLKIFGHLLYYGTLHPKTSMQHSLFQVTGETQDEVVILITSVDALAKSPGSPCAPETYLKVLLVLEALKIIRRKFHRNYTEIRVPLGKREIHIPSLLKALNLLHDGYRNKKVKQIAKKVAKHLQSDEFAKYQGTDLPTQITPDLTPVAQILTSLLGEHGVESVNVPRLAEACTLVSQAIQSGRGASKKGELVGQLKDGTLQISVKKGASSAQSGEFVEADKQLEVPHPDPSRTGTSEFEVKESPDLVNLAPDSATDGREKRPLRVKRGNLQAIFTMESPEFASTSSVLAKLGEFNARVSIIGQYSGDITSNKEETIIDAASETRPYEDTRDIEEIRREVRLYESIFDNKRSRK